MISMQAAKEVQAIEQVPQLLKVASFAKTSPLWTKQRTHSTFNSENADKKYQFCKKGRTFGLETTRYLYLHQNHLFYYDSEESSDFLGYCSIQNIYVQWLPLKNNKFLLVISNINETSLFYFSDNTFWLEQKEQIALYAVLLTFNSQFQVLEELGEGSFAKVYRVKCIENSKSYAAKFISKTSNCKVLKMLEDEKRILSILRDCDYIYQFRVFYETNDEYIILMEYLPGKDLMSLIRMKLDLSLHDIKTILTNILAGLKCCHDKKIVHRDIKPQNIIVDVHSFEIKIIDFGLSLDLEKSDKASFKKCGTMGYMAPQVINCNKIYGQKCDLYSVGVIAHMLLLDSNPLKGKDYQQTCQKNRLSNFIFDDKRIVSKYGNSCLIFLQKLLSPKAESRYSAEQALVSSFLRDSSDKSSVTTEDDRMRQSEAQI